MQKVKHHLLQSPGLPENNIEAYCTRERHYVPLFLCEGQKLVFGIDISVRICLCDCEHFVVMGLDIGIIFIGLQKVRNKRQKQSMFT